MYKAASRNLQRLTEKSARKSKKRGDGRDLSQPRRIKKSKSAEQVAAEKAARAAKREKRAEARRAALDPVEAEKQAAEVAKTLGRRMVGVVVVKKKRLLGSSK
jgi:hypothetical protein